jgi:hypothetical protein
MNLLELQKKLIASARKNPPSEQVPYAFEKRVMARLSTRPALDRWGMWAGALWRAAVPCVTVMLLLSAWSFFVPNIKPAASDLSQEIENTVLAAVEQEQGSDTIW